ncbi:S1/P1 nuclease [Bergeyella sp. RCAD1439]|uniref:S1/P1 nuclease n=1 Tax=Bergeyella anatis TaxID=3113737 RepID=UPI002E175A2C|nr:S1/P1 nuclease [Bergeyella sp. RCAD1439]
MRENGWFCRLAFVVFMAYSFPLWAWGTTGHRVIAEVAENHLNGRAKKELRKLIGSQKLAYWANWPDFIRSDTTGVWKSTEAWHYVNIPPQSDRAVFEQMLQSQKGPNLYTEIKRLSSKLKNRQTPSAERAIALRFLVHLMGDLAQPMHIGRQEDLGGNKIKLSFFGEPTNLHALWDSRLVDHSRYSYSEYARVLDVKNRRERRAIMAGSLEDWFYEYHQVTNTIYAYTGAEKNYAYDYVYRFNDVLERQLYYGGLRLAKVLNECL